MATPHAPSMDVNFADPKVLQDPYPIFDAIRAAGDAVWNPSAGAWMVASYDNVKRVLLDDEHFVPEADKWKTFYGGAVVESLEEPEHGELRGVLAPLFRQAFLREMRPVIESLVIPRLDQLAERLRAGEVVDVVPDVTRAVAGRVLAHMIGVSEDDVPQFLSWAKDMGSTLESFDEPDPERAAKLLAVGTDATAKTCEFAGEQLEHRRHDSSGSDLISQFVRSPITQGLSEEDQRATIAQVIVAGHDNITHTLGQVFITLATYPDQRALVAADRSLIPGAVEEILRWRTSASGDTRLLRGTASIGDVQLEDGARIMVLLSAANRDPSRWDEPHRFDVTRPAQQHITFGAGVHTCLGSNLARLEAAVMMEQLLDRVPEFRLTEPIVFGAPFFMRGAKAIRIGL